MSTLAPLPATLPSPDPSSSSSTSSAQGSNTLGKNDFLKLLMAQLGQQDPTAPQDSSTFVAQLAQFASLELMQNTNDSLQSLLVGQTATQQTQVINMVGKDVTYSTNQVTLAAGGGGTTAGATLATAAAQVTAVVTDANGNTVRTINVGPEAAGSFQLSWDGRDDNGNTQPPGTYTVQVTAADSTGASVPVQQTASGEVTGVSFNGGVTQLLVGTTPIKLSDITQINERTTP